jgi:hypothetical protein
MSVANDNSHVQQEYRQPNKWAFDHSARLEALSPENKQWQISRPAHPNLNAPSERLDGPINPISRSSGFVLFSLYSKLFHKLVKSRTADSEIDRGAAYFSLVLLERCVNEFCFQCFTRFL